MTSTLNTPLSAKRIKRRTVKSGQAVQVLAMLKRLDKEKAQCQKQ